MIINFLLETFFQERGEGGGGWRRVLQIFQKVFRSPGDHGPKYLMAQ